MFIFKHKALDVYERSRLPISVSTFVRSSCTKKTTQITAVSYLLHQYGGVVTCILRKNLTHPSCYQYN